MFFFLQFPKVFSADILGCSSVELSFLDSLQCHIMISNDVIVVCSVTFSLQGHREEKTRRLVSLTA